MSSFGFFKCAYGVTNSIWLVEHQPEVASLQGYHPPIAVQLALSSAEKRFAQRKCAFSCRMSRRVCFKFPTIPLSMNST